MCDTCKSCNNHCAEVECTKVCKSVPKCIETLMLNTGRGAEAVVLNIKGRTKRVYRFLDATDIDGYFNLLLSKLPTGFLSEYTPLYQVWVEDLDGDLIDIPFDGKMSKCLAFEASNVSIIKNSEQSVNDFNYKIN